MRRLILILSLLPALAHAQYFGGYLSKSGGTIAGTLGVTGNVNVQGSLNSTNNTQAAGPTNSGVALGGGPNFASATFFDQTLTANNRTSDAVFITGCMRFRFKNDAGDTALPWLTACGGQAGGITAITSNSGTGSWSHTGNMAVSGALIAGSGTLNVYSANGTAVTTPHVVTGTVTLASGNGTATFTGNAVFSNTTSYVCTATNTSTNSAVRATNASASSVTFNSGTTNDVISYQCIGN
jgi:hypothetical protein